MSGGSGHQSIGHHNPPGPWANGAYFAPNPNLHSDPNSYINRLLAHAKAPTIPDTFTPMNGEGHGATGKKRDWFKIALAGAAAFFGFSVLRGSGKLQLAKEQGKTLMGQIGKVFKKSPTP